MPAVPEVALQTRAFRSRIPVFFRRQALRFRRRVILGRRSFFQKVVNKNDGPGTVPPGALNRGIVRFARGFQ